MKAIRILLTILIAAILFSCGNRERQPVKLALKKSPPTEELNLPVDQGFSEYITGYTAGIVSVSSSIEIRFTPEFAAMANRQTPAGLFMFDPVIKGKTEWKDDVTLVFKPSKILDPGTTYTLRLNLERIAEVKEDLKIFMVRIRTIRKDFLVTAGILESSPEGDKYTLHGEIHASDFIASAEVESYLEAKLGRKKMNVTWDHSDVLTHKFSVNNIARSDRAQELELSWNGIQSGVRQKGTASITIPSTDDFSVIDIIVNPGDNQQVDVIFSDPVDQQLEAEGLIRLGSGQDVTLSISSNIVTLYPATRPAGETELLIEQAVRNSGGTPLGSAFSRKISFSPLKPSIESVGNGVIVPSSRNLVFPFKAANLKAVDIKIIKVFENNLPSFLQENEIYTGYSVKRFGRPVYSGRIDLVVPKGGSPSGWNLYTVDLDEFIDVEPGILYKVELSMRPSYSLYPCTGGDDFEKYEEMLKIAEEQNRGYWDDPENYYGDADDYIYYSFGFSWRDRENPCKAAYYNPDRKLTKSLIASNFGIIAKKGAGGETRIIVNDLLTAQPLSEVSIELYDFQLQQITQGNTGKDGSVILNCSRKPFLLIAKKDRDRNYLKLNEGAALSVSSFDVSGNMPGNGIKAFIYGERDVWRPGDSIYLSVFIRDMQNGLPPDHPVRFELLNPLDQRADQQVQVPGGRNLLVFRSSTKPDDLTGNYTARFTIGGAEFTKRVRIETVKPNRLKIDLDFPGDLLGGTKPESKGTLKVKWLNGAIAGNLRSSVEYLLQPAKTEFSKYPQYIFDDPASRFYPETVTMFEGTLGPNGEAAVSFEPGRQLNAPGMLDAVFTAKVAEKGGDESITRMVKKFAPWSVFTGINLPGLKAKERMLFTDTDNEIKIVTVSPEGNPVDSDVEVALYRISYRWWWESDEEDLGSYISEDIYKPVTTQKITTKNGEASFRFKINRNDWGRYLIRATNSEGHTTGRIVLIDWPWDYGMKGNAEGATLLSVTTDKEKYSPGDDVKLSFPAPENATVIVSLENSTSVLDVIHSTAVKGNTVVTFKAKPEMAPNVYAFVTVIQPHAQTLNDMPMRLYGIVPVMVEDPETHLSPEITAPDEVRPGKPFTVTVGETNRKPMTYTIAVVDEGLLDITGYRTPDPWKHFYAREALGIQTWDLYDLVLGAFGGTLDRLFATGGDETVIDQSAGKARRFIPVVRFLGPFTLGPGKKATHNITLPQYTGAVKAMVIAGNDRAFGSAEKSIFVKDPLMVLPTAPRVVSPGEKVALPVTLFVQKEGITSVEVTAESDDLLSFDGKKKVVTVSGMGETDTEFLFTAGERTGTAHIKVTAAGGGETSYYELDLEVRSPNPPETRSELRLLRPGEKWTPSFTPFGIDGSNSASVEVSSLPSVNLENRLGYLTGYPHGCSEQVTSGAFPQLWIGELVAGNAEKSELAAANVREAINILASRQMNNGGVVLWPGNMQPDNWVTSYAGHFMTEAERKGFSVPQAFRQSWTGFQKKAAQEWRYDPKFRQSANDQAYRLFTLALAGEPERGAMNRLRESPSTPRLSKWLLAAAFALTGRTEVADELTDMRNTSAEEEYSSYYYGSSMRDRAIILYTLSLLKKEEEALPLLKEICDEMNSDSWYSTQSLSWGLLSYMKYTELVAAKSAAEATLRLTVNGERSDDRVAPGQLLMKNIAMKPGTNDLVVENTSAQPLYVNLVRKGIPLVSDNTQVDKGIQLRVQYTDLDLNPVPSGNLEQGTDFIMVAKVTNTGFSNIDNIALTQMVPSGWEIRNMRLFEAEYGIKESTFDYRDFRDDRVSTYFSLANGETKVFTLVLNAAYKGDFSQPAIWCEAMYTENCYSRVPGGRVKVTGQTFE